MPRDAVSEPPVLDAGELFLSFIGAHSLASHYFVLVNSGNSTIQSW